LKTAHLLTTIASDLKPIDYYRKIHHEEYSFFLDSGMDPEKLGRYSFVGHDPFLVFKNKARRIEITRGRGSAGETTVSEGDPFLVLRDTLAPYRIDASTMAQPILPMVGGAVGYLGYELNQHLERLPNVGTDDLALPDMYFLFVDSLIVYDHLENVLYLSAVGFGEHQADADAAARNAQEKMRSFMEGVEAEGASPPDLPGIEPLTGNPLEADGIEMRSVSGKREYMDIVEKAKEHIFAGDIFEVCTTHRLNCDFDGDPWDLYEDLRRGNPAPFASFFNLPEVKIISASPERFMRVSRDGRAESRPIKGTRPRGRDEAEDKANHDDLFASIKDRAENMMIVDLVRNDFGRVCRFNTVEVSELMIIEKYATVFQMVSTIVGQIDEGRDAMDLIRAAWPGGSMTGAPKIEAMGIIDALEPTKRGIYSGSIGYFDFAGHVDFNIVIRTILLAAGVAYVQVGGALVADSDPEDEYLETLDKARALIRALRAAQLRSGSTARAGNE
jgi:para-aminobenzoate synthetase component 1